MLQLSIVLNSFIKYNSTRLIFIEIFYKFKIKESLNLLNINNFKFDNFIKIFEILFILSQIIRNDFIIL